jgi:hypothetical protein
MKYVGVLIGLWIFVFAAQPKEFFLGLVKEFGNHEVISVWSSGGNM